MLVMTISYLDVYAITLPILENSYMPVVLGKVFDNSLERSQGGLRWIIT